MRNRTCTKWYRVQVQSTEYRNSNSFILKIRATLAQEQLLSSLNAICLQLLQSTHLQSSELSALLSPLSPSAQEKLVQSKHHALSWIGLLGKHSYFPVP